MRKWLENASLRSKLTAIAMSATCLALILSGAAFVFFDQYTFKDKTVQELRILADVIGTNLTAALTFGNPSDAHSTLSALAAEPDIIAATVFDIDGRAFAQYLSPGRTSLLPRSMYREPAQQFTENQLIVYRSIDLDGDQIGTIAVQKDLREVQARLTAFGTAVSIVTIASALLVLVLVFRLQRVILVPILYLVGAAKQVSAIQDYSIRVPRGSGDEIGVLITTFNQMLEQIQSRDEALTSAKNELEDRVVERTCELELEISNKKRAEETLRASERRFRAMIERGSDIINVVSHDGLVSYESPSVQTVLGHSPDKMTGRPITDIFHPDQQESAREWLIATSRQPGQPLSFQARVKASDGTWREMEAYATNLIYESAVDGIVVNMRDITDRTHAEAQIKASLAEKEVLLKEIHHRVKNNLQVISSLLNLQSGRIEDEAVREKFLDSERRVRSMALIHERLYRSDDLARIDLAEYINNLVAGFRSAFEGTLAKVRIDVMVEPIHLGVDQAVPTGLIVNELVSNSLKHAFPSDRSGKVVINVVTETPEMVLVTVTDDGVGLSSEYDTRKTRSLGMQLVSTLVKQLAGTLEFDNAQGTSWFIRFPYQSSPHQERAEHAPANSYS